MKLLLIRHGQTAANRERRFLGHTDEPLTKDGAEAIRGFCAAGRYPAASALICSPLLRCRQTAGIIYPELKPRLIPNLIEMDFGLFEGRTNQELMEEPYYQQWLAAGRADFPGGETMAAFSRRVELGFYEGLRGLRYHDCPAFVVHGGVIMSLLTTLSGCEFYDNFCGNGEGYLCRWQHGRLEVEAKL